jgi:hypothetical protein
MLDQALTRTKGVINIIICEYGLKLYRRKHNYYFINHTCVNLKISQVQLWGHTDMKCMINLCV